MLKDKAISYLEVLSLAARVDAGGHSLSSTTGRAWRAFFLAIHELHCEACQACTMISPSEASPSPHIVSHVTC